MERVQIIAILGSLILLGIIFHLVRTKRLRIQYSLLWILTGIIVLIFSIWRGLLDLIARLAGISYPPNALFLIGFLFFLLIMLHFSLVISKLYEGNQKLTQRLAILTWRFKELEKGSEKRD